MGFDPLAPAKLKKGQHWFASIITRPIDEDSRMNPISPAGELMEEEAWDYIKPSPTLRPAQRIQIYNQQYWWRLLKILQDGFPLLTRLFGYHDFNQTIGIPFLQKYTPNHWSLSKLGDDLPRWIEECYHRSDKELIRDAAAVDHAYNHCFVALEGPILESNGLGDSSELNNIIETALCLQPATRLFAFDYQLFAFRNAFLQEEPEYWVENEFPNLDKTPQWAVLYRSAHKEILWEEISESEYHLLSYFNKGASVLQACSWLEDQEGEHFEAASENIHHWLKKWIVKQWLATAKINSSEIAVSLV